MYSEIESNNKLQINEKTRFFLIAAVLDRVFFPMSI
jgi:hypothetical protein